MKVDGINIDGIMSVNNARVYGLEESLEASSYPFSLWEKDLNDLKVSEKRIKKAENLGSAIPGSGHDCYLKGITVQFDLKVPEYIWRQINRYHFIDFISSQSKMHKITKLNVNELCNKYVHQINIDLVNSYIELYNNYEDYVGNPDLEVIQLRSGEEIEFTKENIFKCIIANVPSGLMLTARMTTNYLQLKTIINQRDAHKMQEWIYFTDWCKGLPMLEQLTTKK